MDKFIKADDKVIFKKVFFYFFCVMVEVLLKKEFFKCIEFFNE